MRNTDIVKFQGAFNLRRVPKTLILIAAMMMLACCMVIAQQPAPSPALLPNPVQIVSTVPANGDVNPYGVAFVPAGFPGGTLNPGDILVSNFNNAQNVQGTGSTIVRVPQGGSSSLFFQSQRPYTGLSTALSVLKEGYVMVGSFPTADGTCNTAQAGSLVIINSQGQLVGAVVDNNIIDGPWDMTLQDFGNGQADAFVANALNGKIVRLNMMVSGGSLIVQSATVIGSGYGHRCDPAALVVAPTGLVYDPRTDLLYVASTDDNAVFAISNATQRSDDGGTGALIYQDTTHLHGALAMTMTALGHLLVSNSDVINADPNQPSEIVEFTAGGKFIKQFSVDPQLGGSFGLNVSINGLSSVFAYVDDDRNTLNVWTLPSF